MTLFDVATTAIVVVLMFLGAVKAIDLGIAFTERCRAHRRDRIRRASRLELPASRVVQLPVHSRRMGIPVINVPAGTARGARR